MGEDFGYNEDDDIDVERAIVHLIGKYGTLEEQVETLEEQVETLSEESSTRISKLEKKIIELNKQVEQESGDDSEESPVEEDIEESQSESLSEVPDSLKSVVQYDEPDTVYDDICGLDEVVQQVREMIEWPLTRSDELKNMNIDVPTGVLLYGSPGTGKTMISRAVANENECQFIEISGPELVQSYIGKTPSMIRDLFEFARDHSPCILLFEEIDAIAMERSADAQSAERSINRAVSQLLTEMDGFSNSNDINDIRLLATTNKKEIIDPALLRPGRLEQVIEVPMPNADGRRELFEHYTEEMPTEELNFPKLVHEARNMSGADIDAICNDAGRRAVRDERNKVRQQDLVIACKERKQSKASS